MKVFFSTFLIAAFSERLVLEWLPVVWGSNSSTW